MRSLCGRPQRRRARARRRTRLERERARAAALLLRRWLPRVRTRRRAAAAHLRVRRRNSRTLGAGHRRPAPRASHSSVGASGRLCSGRAHARAVLPALRLGLRAVGAGARGGAAAARPHERAHAARAPARQHAARTRARVCGGRCGYRGGERVLVRPRAWGGVRRAGSLDVPGRLRCRLQVHPRARPRASARLARAARPRRGGRAARRPARTGCGAARRLRLGRAARAPLALRGQRARTAAHGQRRRGRRRGGQGCRAARAGAPRRRVSSPQPVRPGGDRGGGRAQESGPDCRGESPQARLLLRAGRVHRCLLRGAAALPAAGEGYVNVSSSAAVAAVPRVALTSGRGGGDGKAREGLEWTPESNNN
mmetsp:Transcript_10721/g.28151  ORF Transcript_10721/g.28151 Transcript_10721/m.28151 type:complete len:367 (-) Transcript_10721:533-1633(-)